MSNLRKAYARCSASPWPSRVVLVGIIVGLLSYWGHRVDASLESIATETREGLAKIVDRVVTLETWKSSAAATFTDRDSRDQLWTSHRQEHRAESAETERKLDAIRLMLTAQHQEVLTQLGTMNKSIATIETAARVGGLMEPKGSGR